MFGGDKRDRTADLLNAMLPLVMSNPYKQAISSIIYTNIEHYHTHLTTMEVMEFQNYGQNCGQLGTVLADAETIKTDAYIVIDIDLLVIYNYYEGRISMNWVEIGARIRRQRENFGYTREAFADKLDIIPKFCADIELGNKGMSVQTLCNISSILKVSTDYILFGTSQQDCSLSSMMLQHCTPKEQRYAEDILKTFIMAMNSKTRLILFLLKKFIMPTELGAPSRRTLLLFLPPQKENTHRQCCALCKGFQHYGGERCHFVLHRTMVSAAVMTTRTITNPKVKQINSFMVYSLLSMVFDFAPDDRMWFWTFGVCALLLPP